MLDSLNHNSERLHGLDHLRAMAIILVMVFHYGKGIPGWLEPIKHIGWTGVDLFFVLSGYLIGYQILKEINSTNQISFRSFYIKRFFRIIPAYVAVLLVYYSMPNVREGVGMPPLWKFLTFTQNFGLDAQTQNSFSHAWSLCIEEQFYFLLPITILASSYFKFRNGGIYLIAILVILGFVFRLVSWNEHVQPFIDSGNRRAMVFGFIEKIYYPSYNRMDGLTVGVGIATLFTFRPKVKDFCSNHGNIILLIGLGMLVFAATVCKDFISYKTAIYGFPLFSVAYGIIVVAAVSPTSFLYKTRSKTTYVIATLSYAIYLTHKQIYHLVKVGIEKTNIKYHEAWTFWICLSFAVIGGFLLHWVVEKPFLNLRSKVLNRWGLEKIKQQQ